MILGSAGSGKSTLSRQLGEILELPVVHIDTIFWQPGWVGNPRDQVTARVIEEADKEAWVMDGNYSATIEHRAQRADTIIFIDFNRFICLYRVVKRRIKNHGKTRPDMTVGCPERIDWEFLKYTWAFPKNRRPLIIDTITASDKQVYHLKTRKQVKTFVKNMENSYSCNES